MDPYTLRRAYMFVDNRRVQGYRVDEDKVTIDYGARRSQLGSAGGRAKEEIN